MTGRRGVRKQATSTGGPQTLGAGLGQVYLVSHDAGRRGLPVESATRIYVAAALRRGRTLQRLAVARLHAGAITG